MKQNGSQLIQKADENEEWKAPFISGIISAIVVFLVTLIAIKPR